MPVKAIIFDFDGLILDTEAADWRAWQEIYLEFGLEMRYEVWAQAVGAPAARFDFYAQLERDVGREIDLEEVRRRRRKRHHELIAELPLMPGVEDYIRDAKRLGLQLAIGSSSDSHWVTGHLKTHGLYECFDCLATIEDAHEGKPDPAIFLAACRKLHVDPSEAIVLEDSPLGILAARRAGIYCVAVPNSSTVSLGFAGADLIVGSLKDLPLADLLEQIGNIERGRDAAR